MVSELFFTTLLSICTIQLNPTKPFEELECFSNDFSETHRIDDESTMTIFYPHRYQEQPNRDANSNFTTKSFIRDKYVEVGVPYSYSEDSYVLVGKTPLLGFQNNPMEFRTFVELDLRLFPNYDSIISAGLIYHKQSGLLTNIDCYLVNNASFDSINGTTSYSSSYIDTISYSMNLDSFVFDLTDEVVDCLSDENSSLLIELRGNENNKYAQLYSSNDTESYPLLYVTYSGNYFGNAPSFYASPNYASTHENCWGYVKNLGKAQNNHNQIIM